MNPGLLIPEWYSRTLVLNPGVFLKCNSWECSWGSLTLGPVRALDQVIDSKSREGK